MKALGLLLAGCLAALSAPVWADDSGPPTLKVTIEFPGSPGQPVLHPSDHFRVIIENVSPCPLLIISNQDQCLSLEVTEPDGSKETVRPFMRLAGKYVIDFDRVDPGKTQIRDIDPAIFYPKLFAATGADRTVTMRAVFERRGKSYDVSESQYDQQKWPDRPAPWYGKVVSPDYTVVLQGG